MSKYLKVGDLVRDKIYGMVGIVTDAGRTPVTNRVRIHWVESCEILTYRLGVPVLHLEVINETR